jgi:hypothetical protein
MMKIAQWIPDCAVNLQLRLCVEIQCRFAGNRAYEATLGASKEYVSWTAMAKDVKDIVQNCLHCIATILEDKVPRQLGLQVHATNLNKVLLLESLYIWLSRDGKYQNTQLLNDDLSGYLWLVPCNTAIAAAIVNAVIRWLAVLDFVLLWVSDRGSHFKNEVVR